VSGVYKTSNKGDATLGTFNLFQVMFRVTVMVTVTKEKERTITCFFQLRVQEGGNEHFVDGVEDPIVSKDVGTGRYEFGRVYLDHCSIHIVR
jgi:hypothetical protein